MKSFKEALLWIFGSIAVLAIMLGLSWVFMGNDLALYKYFAPKKEAVRRQVFEQTKSYNQGMVQELRQYQSQYIMATPEQKKGLRSVIVHEYADYPHDKLPADLQSFLDSLESQP